MSPLSRNHVKRGTALPDQIVESLRRQIASGGLGPGQRLPTEKELCETYGVSRPVVREAIGRLKHEGIITSRQGSGAFVTEAGASNVFRLDVGRLERGAELQHIVELLVAVEVAVAEKAALRRTSAQLAKIKRALQAIDASIQGGKDGVEEDMLFHRSIANASGNPFFRELTDFLEARARKFIRTARTNSARFVGMPRVVQSEHAAIYESIRRRDPAAARRAAESHLRNAAERLELYRSGE
jgi:GntR family transcriptional regulator, transcriptional repressor for pyruvate dehydrogenase complex